MAGYLSLFAVVSSGLSMFFLWLMQSRGLLPFPIVTGLICGLRGAGVAGGPHITSGESFWQGSQLTGLAL